VDLHLLPLLDEERDADLEARLERGVLRHAAAGGVARTPGSQTSPSADEGGN
jgi:hypothetical protein